MFGSVKEGAPKKTGMDMAILSMLQRVGVKFDPEKVSQMLTVEIPQTLQGVRNFDSRLAAIEKRQEAILEILAVIAQQPKDNNGKLGGS